MQERMAFKKKAYAQPVVESGLKRKERDGDADGTKTKKAKSQTSSGSSSAPRDPFSSGRSTGSSAANFSCLAKIVKHMKSRYIQEDTDALTLDELLDETNQLDIGLKTRQWLETDALRNNPKVEVTDDGKYAFKPVFKLKDKRGLIRLLDRYDREGKGGIALEDIIESLPKAERVLSNPQVASSIIVITRPADKKKIVFFNDKSMQIPVDEEFQKLWRSVPVDGIDEQKIEEYLTKQGITSMQETGVKKVGIPIHKRKKAAAKKGRAFKKTNDHLGDILQDYSDKM